MSCGVGHKRSSDPTLLWLWHKPLATALVRPLAWEPPYAAGAALEMAKKSQKEKKKKERKKRDRNQINKNRNEKEITTDNTEQERICIQGDPTGVSYLLLNYKLSEDRGL